MLLFFYSIYMKISILSAILILLFSCSAKKPASPQLDPISDDRPDGLVANVNKINGNFSPALAGDRKSFTDTLRIKEILTFLASDELEGRDSGTLGIEKAAQYVENYFADNGVQEYFSSFRDTLVNFQPSAYNIVGLVPGKDEGLSKEFIIIGAHYDHVGIVNSGTEDRIANGANDNASGTATVMELARYFGTYRTNKRSLLFVLFSAEEKGLLGSAHLAKRLKEAELNLYTMLNFEMTGVPLKEKDYLVYLTGFERSNLAQVCNTYASENLVGFLPEAKQFNLFQRSDNYPFHQAFRVPSQTYCTFDFTNYDYYHKVGDEAFRLDYAHMSTLINKMIPVIEAISNAADREIKYY